MNGGLDDGTREFVVLFEKTRGRMTYSHANCAPA